ncbi:MAG: bis(5'-nucleosyl)-tetraphosphatase (symmetrical) [Candidatus Muproteobacteria bacterium RBG_19FT_COMBO_61_10]|uniref:Bis(5'-nucleosyl)-tetraphosphatase, symmetrical n=1 Tax=Candidatus Muproteobacteria bacterium RBG_19FT_COMBO_61_10 TaxID=1817761 RepID=A0A1F6UJX8_9PROT|nr:MAG: bis(5'-nucleosyl)-tetraphosphatase (symmetrical) [Candidatus Muproteobacteria bacterium RBG_19FT_COMBO_61_10]
MAVYAIGDVQGCFDPLRALLDKLNYDPGADCLWFAGDLVNRGPQSLQVLRFVRSLPKAVVVLGNHDLHLLAVASGQAPRKKHDTFDDVLCAPDRDELLGWLRTCPLLHHDAALGSVLVHAGLLPQWDLAMALRLAAEAGESIRRSDRNELFTHMYGDLPDHWQDDLGGWARLRIIINAFTRLRYCDAHGRMDLRPKGRPGKQASHLLPWFQVPARMTRNTRIVFGHWSTLGLWDADGVIALDSGCLWGGKLTAVRLDAGAAHQFTAVPCAQILAPHPGAIIPG